MKFGVNLMDHDVHRLSEQTLAAEEAGWDGVFLPDCISIEFDTTPAMPFYDPWVMLGALAVQTKRMRLGTLLTAIPRRRPWKLARETATLDHLSGGRAILVAGLGVPEHDAGFHKVGEATDLKTRAERLDEGLEILGGMWSAKPFTFSGRHYTVETMTMVPPPVQKPRLPVWVVGVWPKEKSMRRTLRWDGLVPQRYQGGPEAPPWTADEVRELRDYVEKNRTGGGPFDIVVGDPYGKRAAKVKKAREYSEAGATWWIEMLLWEKPEDALKLIREGPFV